MTDQFDAGQVHDDPLDADTLAEQDRELEELKRRPIGLSNARLHAERDLEGLSAVCNRIAWGGMPSEMRGPTREEAAALLHALSQEDRDKLMEQARLASVQRHWLERLQQAEQHHLAEARAEADQRAQAEVEATEWAEFEACDAAGKQERFRQWRAAKRGKA